MEEKRKTKPGASQRKRLSPAVRFHTILTIYQVDMHKRMDGPETMMAHDGQDHTVTRTTCTPFISHSHLQDRLGNHWITLFFYSVATFSKFPLSAFSPVFS